MTTERLFKELKETSDRVEKRLFECVQMAHEVLGDSQWINDNFNGDYDKACEHLELEYFQHFDLRELLAIYQRFPTEREWIRQWETTLTQGD